MKAVLISIRPKYCELIVSGKKTIEVRKTRPKIETPFKCYIYCTKPKMVTKLVLRHEDYPELKKTVFCKVPDGSSPFCSEVNGNGKVIGEFVCDKVDEYNFHNGLTEFNAMGLPCKQYGSYLIFSDDYKKMCLSYDEVKDYGKGKTLYGWHISDLKLYDKPMDLFDFLSYEKHKKCLSRGCFGEDCWICPNNAIIIRPPQSWCYVEEV